MVAFFFCFLVGDKEQRAAVHRIVVAGVGEQTRWACFLHHGGCLGTFVEALTCTNNPCSHLGLSDGRPRLLRLVGLFGRVLRGLARCVGFTASSRMVVKCVGSERSRRKAREVSS